MLYMIPLWRHQLSFLRYHFKYFHCLASILFLYTMTNNLMLSNISMSMIPALYTSCTAIAQFACASKAHICMINLFFKVCCIHDVIHVMLHVYKYSTSQ